MRKTTMDCDVGKRTGCSGGTRPRQLEVRTLPAFTIIIIVICQLALCQPLRDDVGYSVPERGPSASFSERKGEVYIVRVLGMSAGMAAYYDSSKSGFQYTDGDGEIQPISANTYAAQQERTHDSLCHQLSEISDDNVTKLYSYYRTINGFAAVLTPEQAEILRGMRNVLSVMKSGMMQSFATEPATIRFMGLNNPSVGVYKRLGSSSKAATNLVLGVVDTGVWPEHQSFRSVPRSPRPSTFKGKCVVGTMFRPKRACRGKLIGAKFFVSGYNMVAAKQCDPGDPNSPCPIIDRVDEYLSPRGFYSHGTHTSSAAVGMPVSGYNVSGFVTGGTMMGVAPGARLAVYKVLWGARGNGADADVAAGIDEAIKDRVAVLNLSLGGGNEDYVNGVIGPSTLVAYAMGIITVAAAGNFGNGGSFTVRNVAPWVITVAASSVDVNSRSTIGLASGQTVYGTSFRFDKVMQGVPLVYGRTAVAQNMRAADAQYCLANTLSPSVRGKVVICDRGVSTRLAKSLEVARVGGTAMILANLATDRGEPFTPYPIPTVHISYPPRQVLLSYINSFGPIPNISITAAFEVSGEGVRAPIVGSFSGLGPNQQTIDILKPDITAPGVDIVGAASYSDPAAKLSSAIVLTGTSMAAPHVAGVALLLRDKYPNWTPGAIKSAMMTTAYQFDNREMPIGDDKGNAGSPFMYGAGQIDPNRALDPGLVYDTSVSDYVSFLCGQDYSSQDVYSIVGESCPTRPIRPVQLNLPSITKFALRPRSNFTIRRTLKDVGGGGTYTAVMDKLPFISVGVTPIISPQTLKFLPGEVKTYTLTLSVGVLTLKKLSTFTFLTWKQVDGPRVVTIPVTIGQ